ncbi:MAG TPA: hypothetical protein PLC19_08575, partial [Marmoricola sp.]|nr:hypothetical protein [Marmoricola sp.]
MLAEKMLYGEVGPGQIVLIDIEGEGASAVFTFKGTPKSELPDAPIFEPVGGHEDVATDSAEPSDGETSSS